jgi:hypothetical protein
MARSRRCGGGTPTKIRPPRAALRGGNRDPDPGALCQRERSWALALKKRLGFKRAAVALARKLVVVLHVMWKIRKNFDPNHRLAAA